MGDPEGTPAFYELEPDSPSGLALIQAAAAELGLALPVITLALNAP